MYLYEESNQFRAELEQQVKNVDIREITQLPNFKNWFNSKKAHSKCYEYDLPKLFYRTLNSIDNLDNIVNGNEQSRFVGEYFTDDLDTALTYIEHLENSKVLIGFLNIQNPAIIDCNGAGWNEIRQNATVTEQLAYFEYLGFNEKPDNFEENRAYPIDLRNDEKDEGISFFLQIKTINKDTTPSFIKITAPQYYQNDRSFRKTKFINLDMLGYGTPSLFNDIGTTNFWATNLAHRHRFDSVIFENLNDDGGRGVTLFEKSVKKRKMQGTVVCAFDRENSYFKHANNHGDFNPDDRRIFYSLFDIEQDFKQEKTEKDKTMENQTMQQTQATQQTAAQGGFSSPKNPENTVNYDVRGLPEFSGSVAAYFNNSERQELVLAFLKTAERSKDLRSQVFLGIPYEEQKQFDRIAAFSPLELSAILDCKPEFANNMRDYMAVVEDFERNHQQKLEDFKKALHALKISPKYQAATIRNRIFDENDLRAEYIDGGKAFAFTKTGEITNGDRLKQVIANAIDAIAPAVKYSLSQTEFWQERDDKAFIKQSQIRDLLRSQMSFPAEMVEVKTLHQIWNDDRDMHDTISKSTAGFFTPKNGKTVVIADAFIENPELAVFTAYHELGHRGIELQGRELWNDWLQQARQNPTVRAIADHAQVHYASKGNILSDIAATEEALVEVFAAYKTQNWDYLAERHNVEIPQEFKKPQGTAEKLWNAAKNRIGQIFGRQPETVSDAAVFAMLGKLEQSLYQFPEWKQKLEKTVSVGQHNPFAVAKQPIISGRPRVNPTALTNRYRSGGLRFDLNEQEQAMKSSQEVLAEVIGKYKNHIDSQDGLMNRPLHWLSAAELEDRRTVLSYRIDKVIQNRESRDKLHQLNGEYRNVENEMARRKTLSDNLKEVLESQSETLSVRDFVVLTDGRDELRRQIWHTTGNFELEEKINQELAVIKAKIDSCWKRPETLSIDDELALTERGLRQVNMYIEQGRYSANGVDDRFVQERIAERTKLLDKLKTLKEQAAEKGGLSSPENTVKQDAFGLPEKEKNMQDIEERYYAKFPNATHPETFTQLAKEQGKTDEEIKNALTDIFDEHFRGEQWEDKFGKSFVLDIPTNFDWEDKEATFVPVIMPLEEVKSEMRFTLSDDLSGDLSRYLSDYKESGALVNLEYAIAAYEEYRQKTADFFGIEQSQVAEFLGYTEPKELLEKARQIVSGSPEQTVEVKQDAFSQSEKENTMNETEKQALARAFKLIEGFDADIHWQEVQMVKELQNRPESEIVAALAWDEVATAMQDFVEEQSESNTLKLRNAYMAYPLYNELANKGIPNDENLQRQYGIVIADKRYSSFDERRTAALFILQSVWNGRGNTTSITRSYNIDAMTAYIARTQPKYFDSWAVDRNVNERFLIKSSIFTHKNLREMGLDNNSNLAPYAPELLQEMVKIEEKYTSFVKWQDPNVESGWYSRGAENVIDFKQIPAAVQKDLILMISHKFSPKRDMFGVYDNYALGMQQGLANREEVKHNLELLIEQQENQLQEYRVMALGVSVPQEDAIVEQINLYKQTLEQVKNAPAVAFVPEKVLVSDSVKDWQTGEVQRYNTMEINTKTGEIAFVNDKNNPNPNPFGDMTEQARQYLSANNNFTLAALGVAPKEMLENVKFDDFGTTETEPRLGYDAITLSSGEIFLPVISNFADTQLKNADFKTATNSLGERRPIDGDDYAKFENHQSQANFFYCVNTQEFVLFVENPSKEHFLYNVDNRAFYRFDKIDIQSQIENRLSEKQQGITASATLTIEQQRIEKREQIFDILFAVSPSMSNVEHENADFRANNIWANYGNMSIMYGRFDVKTGDFKYCTYGGDDIFVINTDKISARTAATAFLRGVDEYKEKFVYGKSTALTPKKRRDIQNTVDFSIAENRRMEDISSYQDRRERLARIERQYAERETQKQTAEKSGFSSPENMKFDDFGVSENGNAMKIDTSLPIEEQYKLYQLAEERISRQYSEASAAVQYLQGQKGISGFNPERLEKAIAEESKFAKQLDDLRQANPEFALMARAKHLDPKDLMLELRNELQQVNEWVKSQKQAAEIKQDAFGLPEKSYGQVLNEYLRLKSEMSKVDTDIQNTYDRREFFENNPEMQGSPAHLSINSDIQRLESKYADLETQKMQIEKDYLTISQDEQKFSDLQSQLSNFSGAIERTKSNLEQLEKEFAEVQSEVVELGMEKAAVSGLDNEAVAIFSKFNLEKNSLKEAYVGKVRVLKAISEWEKSANIQLQLITPQERAKFAQELDDFLKQDAFGVPETPKTLNPKEQALEDGKALAAAEQKISTTHFELAKQPNNAERQMAYKQAQADLTALTDEIKSRVQAAMNKGEPYVIRYDEVPTAPFNGEKAPIELVVTRTGNLRLAIGMNDTPHNLTAVDSTPEIALNAEQRSTPERVAEVLRERFNQPTAAVADQIACINYPNADKVFSEDEIKEALNRALKSSFKEHQLAAIHSPRMKDEWLECVIEKHNNPKVVATAQKVLEERQSLSSPTLSDNLEPENHTAAKGSFSSSEHEEELAIVVDDDDYGRD